MSTRNVMDSARRSELLKHMIETMLSCGCSYIGVECSARCELHDHDCKRCKHPIPAEGSLPADPGLIVERSSWFVAWLAGFCSPVCQANDALTQVALSEAWWLKEKKR